MYQESFFQIAVHDRLGVPLGEFERAVNVVRSYMLSKSSQLSFDLAISDPKCDPTLLRMNNIVLVRSNLWPTWSGYITGRDWQEDHVTITCQSIENRLQKRLTQSRDDLEDELAGAIFRLLLSDANAADPTGIDVGSVDDSGDEYSMAIGREVVYDKLNELVGMTKYEWAVRLVYPGSWQMDFLRKIGSDLTATVAVQQGCDINGIPQLQEDGVEYANSVIAVGHDPELASDDQPEATYTDWTAVGREGLQQVVVNFEAEWDDSRLGALARLEVWKRKAPRRTLSFELSNQRSLFGSFFVGDYITVVLPYYGFSGMAVPLRVLGIEVNEDNGVASISGEVVVGEDAIALDMVKSTQYGFPEEYLAPPAG